jgi:hypothetical protein
MEAVYGRDFSEMEAQLYKRELVEFVQEVGADSRETWLYGDLAGRDPDDAPGPIVYDKGFFFLRHLEETIGRESWDRFLQNYFSAHSFQSMTTARFVEELQKNLLDGNPEAARKAQVQAWVYGPGLPAGIADPQSSAFARVDVELSRLAAGAPPGELATTGWVTQQWQHFLRNLPPPVDGARLAALDAAFHLTDSGNAEILFDWFERAIASAYRPAYPALERFLLSVGRRKFVAPLYADLARTPEGLAFAREVYSRARPGYHPLAQLSIDGLLQLREDSKPNG